MFVLASLLSAASAPLLAFVSPPVQDVGFRLLEPANYSTVAAAIPTTRAEDRQLLKQVEGDAHAVLNSLSIRGEVSSRVKSIYSTHRKMTRKGTPMNQILDRLAMRIIVNTEAECYAVMDQLNRLHPPISGSSDDYIAHPKPNGYRSLHTAARVLGTGTPVEFQVRTREMHDAAEAGPAAHWRYKLEGQLTAA